MALAGPAIGAAETIQRDRKILGFQKLLDKLAFNAAWYCIGRKLACLQGQPVNVPVDFLVFPEMTLDPGGKAARPIGTSGIEICPRWQADGPKPPCKNR